MSSEMFLNHLKKILNFDIFAAEYYISDGYGKRSYKV